MADVLSYDFIIVGAGSAGCVLAERLSASGRHSVLVLEAGGSDRRFFVQMPLGYGKLFYDPTVNWCYRTEPDPGLGGRRDYWPRGKLLGGSSAINAMVYIRGHRSDYEDWAAAGKSGKLPAHSSATGCRELIALLKRAPNPFVAGLEQHVKLGADKPWGVQLAGGFNRTGVMAMYARAIRRLGAVIGDRDPSLLGSIWRSRGTRTFYQVRIGADSRTEANVLCNRIRRAGGACLVLRNPRVKG